MVKTFKVMAILIAVWALLVSPAFAAEFTKIDVSGNYDIEINCGHTENALQDKNGAIDGKNIKIENGTLIVDPSVFPYGDSEESLVFNVKNISEVIYYGTGKLVINNIDNQSIRFETTGTAEIEANGKTAHLVTKSSGSSIISASELMAKKADIESSGTSNVHVHATDVLNVNATGVSSVYYSGNPKTFNPSTSFTATVEKE